MALYDKQKIKSLLVLYLKDKKNPRVEDSLCQLLYPFACVVLRKVIPEPDEDALQVSRIAVLGALRKYNSSSGIITWVQNHVRFKAQHHLRDITRVKETPGLITSLVDEDDLTVRRRPHESTTDSYIEMRGPRPFLTNSTSVGIKNNPRASPCVLSSGEALDVPNLWKNILAGHSEKDAQLLDLCIRQENSSHEIAMLLDLEPKAARMKLSTLKSKIQGNFKEKEKEI